MVSILPFEFVGSAMQSDALASLKILRIVRLLRLIKLVRVFRASRLIKRWEMSMDMSYSNLSLLKFLVLVFISVHWVSAARERVSRRACALVSCRCLLVVVRSRARGSWGRRWRTPRKIG